MIYGHGLYILPMTITKEQYERIADCFPRRRGNLSLHNLPVFNAIPYIGESGCNWRALPKEFDNWHTIYTRMNRWSKNGALPKIFERFQSERLIVVKSKVLSFNSIIIKVHPDGTGALKKQALNPSADPEADGQPNFIWSPGPLNMP